MTLRKSFLVDIETEANEFDITLHVSGNASGQAQVTTKNDGEKSITIRVGSDSPEGGATHRLFRPVEAKDGDVWFLEPKEATLVPEKYRDVQDWWFSYECLYGDCPESQAGHTGVVLDVRISDKDGHRDPPEIPCPSCHRLMDFRARWRACSNGYGSRGSPCGGGKGENHAEDLT